MVIRVKFFGADAQTLGAREVAVELPDSNATCAVLRERVAAMHPRIAPALAAGRFAVNQEFAAAEQRLRGGDEVAFIGAVSGG
jgi:molybdopterin synthase catalytic subunit